MEERRKHHSHRFGIALSVVWIAITAALLAASGRSARQPVSAVTVDYPEDGSIFPPEFPPPTFLWRDDSHADLWLIKAQFADGSPGIEARSAGEPMRVGDIDPRCVAPTNELPKLTAEQAAAHTWTPDNETWARIKAHSRNRPAAITITGYRKQDPANAVSVGRVNIQTSTDEVGAPIFYRDVPLMPAATEKGVIKPLVAEAIPLIAWRLRDVREPRSRLLMENLPTCANCHSVSRDGKTLGMDVDGPQNDKGLYALSTVEAHTSIRNEDVITWKNVYQGRLGGRLRVGFMSQVSPDGQFVITTINDPGVSQTESQRRANPQDLVGNYFVTNFKDYRFGQVFYPTRGILAWYSRATGQLRPLPGADDPEFVHTGATWSTDGSYLVFSRAKARESYPPGAKVAEYANDPNETQIQYDLYRMPFNGGKGGRPEPLAGASSNGMSNSFPKISPDGRWIVFVQCRNGQLMRPDSQLYIIPAAGGEARRMRCNTKLMNSWHSFSPNGRWLVFSSKSRSPYTQMFLTHLDENGQDSPAILIENTTAANRAVNIPEFLPVPPGGLVKMDAPATDFCRLFDVAAEMVEDGEFEKAIPELRRALELNPEDVRSHNKLGIALAGVGRIDEAMAEYQKALALDPDFADAHMKLGMAMARQGRIQEAKQQIEKALELFPDSAEAHSNLAALLVGEGRFADAIGHCEKALSIRPEYPGAHANLGIALVQTGNREGALPHFEKALAGEPDFPEIHLHLGRLLAEMQRFDEAIPHLEKALEATPDSAPLRYNLARLLAAKGSFDTAIPHFEKVVQMAPDFGPARRDLMIALGRLARIRATSSDASLRNGAEAVALAERAVQLSGGQDALLLDTLSVAYAEAGRFQEAIQTARRALDLARQQNNQALVSAIPGRIAAYEAGKPVRE
ncbi:MAG: tetratricopeptide repeat protein [Acidobacteria bacterium]|nr:MAG: tetratricopeptide repeat protein [Acidobacteriota bacterium]